METNNIFLVSSNHDVGEGWFVKGFIGEGIFMVQHLDLIHEKVRKGFDVQVSYSYPDKSKLSKRRTSSNINV